MKKLLVLASATAALIPAIALAAPLSKGAYCYPTSPYWQKQVAAYPDYYASHDSYYQSHFGATTHYCI